MIGARESNGGGGTTRRRSRFALGIDGSAFNEVNIETPAVTGTTGTGRRQRAGGGTADGAVLLGAGLAAAKA